MDRLLIHTFVLFVTLLLNARPNGDSIHVCPPCDNTCDDLEYHGPGVYDRCHMLLVQKDLPKTIAFYLQDGVEVLDFAGPMEVFSYAGYKVFTVSKTAEPIKSQGILTIVPDYSIDNAPKADILAFFGGNSSVASQNKKVIDWVKEQENVQHYFSVCTGAFILAEAGLLDGKTATTFHNALEGLENGYSKIDVRRNVRFVDNGKEITTAGISAGIDGALHLVAKLQGVNAAKRTAYYMEYDNWNIGDGLILTDTNPYAETISSEELKTFIGTYEYKNGSTIEVAHDLKNGNLIAVMGNNRYPIYHEEGNLFSDVDNEPISFERDGQNQVTGYFLDKGGKVFKKLD